ncbi:hypothetical protein L3i22_014630 [Actinoplanes sp. L3-i22]|nr:hypothetical protein L3i22_014630 [Actinoplanes sp. L3-i22]
MDRCSCPGDDRRPASASSLPERQPGRISRQGELEPFGGTNAEDGKAVDQRPNITQSPQLVGVVATHVADRITAFDDQLW